MRAGRGMRAMLGALLLTSVAAAPALAQARFYVGFGPPAAVIERPVPPPGPNFVWTPGYYRWDGADYNWQRGRWVRPPRHGERWVPSRWDHNRNGWYFVDGRWRR